MGGLENFLDPLAVQDDTLCQLAVDLSKTYRNLALTSTDQFLATPVNVLPHGRERGKFLAIDVGGSNLRVAFIDLLGDSRDHLHNISRSYEKSWSIEEHLKFDQAHDLFRWIGDCIAAVIRACLSDDKDALGSEIPIGITFSFPMLQRSITEATLMPMGKGFAISKDANLAELLLAGYAHTTAANGHDSNPPLPKLKITAITNDTVATLASLSYSAGIKPNTRVVMGLIVGTGTNATIPMELRHLHESKRSGIKMPAPSESDEASTIVNTEWTIKGTAGPLHDLGIVTRWDVALDAACEAPGFQPFEYMTSGRYLGELVRLIVVDWFVNVERTKPDDLPPALNQRNSISTVWLSRVVAKTPSPDKLVSVLQQDLQPPATSSWSWTHEHAYVLKKTTETVSLRSSKLIAAATVGLMGCVARKTLSGLPPEETEDLVVACTGGLFLQYPGFFRTCQDCIDDLVGELNIKQGVRRVKLQEAPDGGIIGAGVLAGTVWNLPNDVAMQS
ncbi:hypothetical protein FH972_026586 [Carpinus fangiana]|uniref:Phosphotransferase n=1 Tax=Carpinus fangiana TaxID=176857 RepID=A0A5N6L4Q8_9ROSI|nr:hypothetical protein FH972_026586 [Carpinus fangiana]